MPNIQHDLSSTFSRRMALGTLLGAVTLVPAMAHAQMGTPPKMAALMGGEFALQTSQLALRRSRNAAVRQFVQLESNEQVAYAAAMGAQPGSAPLRPDREQMLAQLSAASGAAFDRMYVRGQILGHEELLAINQAIASSGGDPVARSVAILAVPSMLSALRRV